MCFCDLGRMYGQQTKTLLLHKSYLLKNFKCYNMKEHIHLKISASDKQELVHKAKELGLSLSGYIRSRLKENHLNREIT